MAKTVEISVGPSDKTVDLHDGVDLKSVRYGRWNDRTSGDRHQAGRYLLPALLGGSDYSGSLVERSNYKAFSELFSDGFDEWWTNAPGGHGTFAVLIDMQSVPEEVETEVAEFLNALHDYPLADYDLHSEMEMEAQSEAWENWAKKDFTRALEKEFDVDLDGVSDEAIFGLFRVGMDRANVEWVNESGDSMYIDIKRIVAKISEEDLQGEK